LKKAALILLLLITLFSCKKPKEEEVWVEDVEVTKPIVDFGIKFSDYNVDQDTVKYYDNFSRILVRQNLNGRKINDIINKVKDSLDLKLIKRNKAFTFFRSKDRANKVKLFVFQPDQLNYILVDLRDSIVVYKKARPLTFKVRTVAGKLSNSLSQTLRNEKLDIDLKKRLIKVYAWSVDFFKSKKGDKFAMSFTERYINDTIYDGIDSLRCAFVEYKGKKIYAFPFVQDTLRGKTDYYDENANALRNFFLKAPLKVINITSKYSLSRFHPVQQVWKAHNGTDYAAPTGTPIMTTASGVVEQAGYTAGNGNFVKVKHDKTYSTQYLHMSKILVKKGQSVKQGDIIGKVGSTGLATGPHVCYRFWKDGKQVDALKLKLPNSEPMDAINKPRYFKYIAPLKRELDSVAAIKFGEKFPVKAALKKDTIKAETPTNKDKKANKAEKPKATTNKNIKKRK
jgi:murein DD-endopeptidase MepM/ murein hydrolase activator NlpD